MTVRLKVFHKGLLLVGAPLVVELILIACLSVLLFDAEQEKTREMRYRRGAVVSAHLVALTAEVPLLVAGSLEYHADALFKKYEKDVQQIEADTKEINQIRKDCPEIAVPFKDSLQSKQAKILAVAAKYASTRYTSNVAAKFGNLLSFSQDLNAVSTSTTEDLVQMEAHNEAATADTRQKQIRISQQQNWVLLIGIVANLGIAALLAIYFRRDILQRVLTITNNTIALSQGRGLKEPLDGNDEIALVDHSFHEMHEQLLAASAREQALFDNALGIICVLNRQLEIQRINPACSAIWEYSASELTGAALTKLLLPEQIESVVSQLVQTRELAAPLVFESAVLTRSGKMKDMLWSAYWSESEESFFCTVHDLTEDKQLEKAKAAFLQIISGNLKLPLSSISTSLEELLQVGRGISELALEKLRFTKNNVMRLLELVNDLLQVNQLDSAHVELKKQHFCLVDTLERAIAEVRILAESKEIGIVSAVEKDIDCYADPNRLIQVLINLLSNAVKFSAAKTSISVSAQVVGDFLRFEVVDAGRGVPPEQKALIFERFKQVEAADANRGVGTGLGLPICKQIVVAHGGSIGVDDAAGGGSVFWFSIPSPGTKTDLALSQAKQATAIARKEVDSNAGSETTSLSSGKIKQRQNSYAGRISLILKGVLLVGIPVASEFVLVYTLAVVLTQVDNAREFELKQRLISNYANAIMLSCIEAETRMGHPYSADEWKVIQEEMDSAHKFRDKLNRAIKGEPSAGSYVAKADISFRSIDQTYELAKESVANGSATFLAFAERHATLPALLNLFHNLDKVIEIAESKEFASPTKQRELRQLQGNILAYGLVTNIVAAILLAAYFGKDINSRLMVLADNANRLARGKPLNEEQSGDDEIARLDRIFHTMATALIEARRKERAIFDNSQDIICVLGNDGRFLSVNPACEKIWGYSADSLLEKSIMDITYQDDLETVRTRFTSGDFEPELRFHLSNRIVAKDGSIIFTQWSCSREERGSTLYCIAQDITSKKQLELLKQEFLSMVSHDLRSPLTAIHATTQLTSSGAFGPVSDLEAERLGRINNECRALVELVSDLLDIEKLETGNMKFQFEEIELADAIRKAMDDVNKTGVDWNSEPDASGTSYAELAELEKPKLKLEYTTELDEVVVSAEQNRLTQALTNVFAFASRYANDTASANDIASANDTVRVRLSKGEQLSTIKLFTSGPHLSSVEFLRFFDLYSGSQSQSAFDSLNQRLSLRIANYIIEEHRGTLTIEDGQNGTTFVISLPYVIED